MEACTRREVRREGWKEGGSEGGKEEGVRREGGSKVGKYIVCTCKYIVAREGLAYLCLSYQLTVQTHT